MEGVFGAKQFTLTISALASHVGVGRAFGLSFLSPMSHVGSCKGVEFTSVALTSHVRGFKVASRGLQGPDKNGTVEPRENESTSCQR